MLFRSIEYPRPAGLQRKKLIHLFGLAEELCNEYLEKPSCLRNLELEAEKSSEFLEETENSPDLEMEENPVVIEEEEGQTEYQNFNPA